MTHVQNCCLLIKPIAFVAFPLPSPSSDLKVTSDRRRLGTSKMVKYMAGKLTLVPHKQFYFSITSQCKTVTNARHIFT